MLRKCGMNMKIKNKMLIFFQQETRAEYYRRKLCRLEKGSVFDFICSENFARDATFIPVRNMNGIH